MKLELEALILSTEPKTEKQRLVTLFTQERGLVKARVFGSLSSLSQQQLYQPGSLVRAELSYKRQESDREVPVLKAELDPFPSQLQLNLFLLNSGLSESSFLRFEAVRSLYALLELTCPWGHPIGTFYSDSLRLARGCLDPRDHPLYAYALWEFLLLQFLGVGLDVSSCVKTGGQPYYISPKTGQAVSQEIGEPYKDRLFLIPRFYHELCHETRQTQVEKRCELAELATSLEVTRYFLNQRFLYAHGKKVPAVREQLETSFQQIKERTLRDPISRVS